MVSFRSLLLKTLPDEYVSEFRMELLKENISRIKFFSISLFVIEMLQIVLDYSNYINGLWESEHIYKYIFYLHFLPVVVMTFFIVLIFSRRRKHNPSPAYIWFEWIFIFFILIWSSVSCVVQLPIAPSVTLYMLACFCTGLVFYFNSIIGISSYTLSFLLLIVGLNLRCNDITVFKELITDASIMMIISYIVSRINYKTRIETFVTQKKIEVEIADRDLAEQTLQKLNSRLESIVKDRTQTLIDINEKLNIEIGERKSLEQRLLTEKNILNSIIDLNPYSIAIFDKNGYFIKGNPSGKKIFEVEPLPDYCFFEDVLLKEKYHLEFQRLKHGETVSFPELHYYLNRSDLGVPDLNVYLKTDMFSIKNNEGEIENYIQIHENITEKKHTEEALKNSEERYRMTVEKIEEGIFVTSKGVFLNANAAMTKMFGYSQEEFIGKPSWNLATPDTRENVKNEIFRKVSIKDLTPICVDCVRKNGDSFSAEIRISGITDTGIVYGLVFDVTEQKRLNEILKESEEKYRLLVNNISEVFYLLDLNGKIVYISDLFEKITDYKINKVIGKSLTDFIFPDDLSEYLNCFSNTLSNIISSCEIRILLKNGEEKYVKTSGKLLVKDDGSKQIIGILTDITQLKLVEKNLRMIESAINQSTEGIAVADMDGNFIYLNDAWAKLHGYSKSELIGKNLNICHSYEQIVKDVIPFNLLVIKNGLNQGEVGHLKKDGTLFPTWMATTLLKDDRNNPSGFIGIARDISSIKQTEVELVSQEKKYMQLFNNAPAGILTVDLNGNILEINAALLKIIGSPSSEQTKKINALTFPNLVEAGISYKLQECIATSRQFVSEHYYLSKWGKSLYMRIHFKPIFDEESNMIEVLTIIDDITDQKINELNLKKTIEDYRKLIENSKQSESVEIKQLQINLVELKNKIELSKKHWASLLNNLTKEIKLPVNSITGFSKLLKKTDLPEKKLNFIASSLAEKSNLLLKISKDIITLSQIDMKTIQYNKNIFNPCELINEVVLQYVENEDILHKKILLGKSFEIPVDIPIVSDSNRLRQILTELVDNSIKNTNYGKIELGIRQQDDDFVLFYVSDTGIGLSPDKQKVFFENIHKVDVLSDADWGILGIGLTICKRLVENLGGKFWMHSEEGRGTTFYFTIPVGNQ